MKNKKGFTLIEILVTIAIIAVILLIAVPSVMKISASMKQRAYAAKRESIISAAELYATRNKDAFGNATQIQIKVRTLIYSGDVDIDVKGISEGCNEEIGCVVNPVDNTSINDELIAIKRVKSITQAKFGEIEPTENQNFVEYIVYFNYNGATESGPTSMACSTVEGGSCSLKSPSIQRDSYNKIGWNIDSNAHDKLVSTEQDITISEDNNGTTYYAITSKQISATFVTNGATSIGTTSIPCTIYNTATACNVTTPTITRTDGTAIGWNTNANATAASVGAGGLASTDGNTTYYAITSKTLTATFNSNGVVSIGATSIPCTMYNTATACNVTTPTITVASDKILAGWNTVQTATTQTINVGGSASISSNITYYAIQRQGYACYTNNVTNTYTCKSALQSQAPYTTDSEAASGACSSIANVTGCSQTSQTSGPYTYSTSDKFCILGKTGRENAVSCDSTASNSVLWKNCSTSVSSTNVYIDVDVCDQHTENSTKKYSCLKELFRKIMEDTDSGTKTSLCSTEVQAGSSHADSIWLFYNLHTTDKSNYFYEKNCESYKNRALVGTFGECNLKGFNPIRTGTTTYGYNYYIMSYNQSSCGGGTVMATNTNSCKIFASGKYENGACPSSYPNQVTYGTTSGSC